MEGSRSAFSGVVSPPSPLKKRKSFLLAPRREVSRETSSLIPAFSRVVAARAGKSRTERAWLQAILSSG